MGGNKVREISANRGRRNLKKVSKGRPYLSVDRPYLSIVPEPGKEEVIVQKEKTMDKEGTIAQKAGMVLLELFYSAAATYFIGRGAVAFAYEERGYQAYGGEYLVIMLTFMISYYVICRFFENIRR